MAGDVEMTDMLASEDVSMTGMSESQDSPKRTPLQSSVNLSLPPPYSKHATTKTAKPPHTTVRPSTPGILKSKTENQASNGKKAVKFKQSVRFKKPTDFKVYEDPPKYEEAHNEQGCFRESLKKYLFLEHPASVDRFHKDAPSEEAFEALEWCQKQMTRLRFIKMIDTMIKSERQNTEERRDALTIDVYDFTIAEFYPIFVHVYELLSTFQLKNSRFPAPWLRPIGELGQFEDHDFIGAVRETTKRFKRFINVTEVEGTKEQVGANKAIEAIIGSAIYNVNPNLMPTNPGKRKRIGCDNKPEEQQSDTNNTGVLKKRKSLAAEQLVGSKQSSQANTFPFREQNPSAPPRTPGRSKPTSKGSLIFDASTYESRRQARAHDVLHSLCRLWIAWQRYVLFTRDYSDFLLFLDMEKAKWILTKFAENESLQELVEESKARIRDMETGMSGAAELDEVAAWRLMMKGLVEVCGDLDWSDGECVVS